MLCDGLRGFALGFHMAKDLKAGLPGPGKCIRRRRLYVRGLYS